MMLVSLEYAGLGVDLQATKHLCVPGNAGNGMTKPSGTIAWIESLRTSGLSEAQIDAACRAEEDERTARQIAAGFDLSAESLQELAKRFPPPQAWFESDEE